MAEATPKPPQCPRCGGTHLTLCGQSVQYRPETYPGQPLSERAVQTLAYQCDCGLGFTETVAPGDATGSSP